MFGPTEEEKLKDFMKDNFDFSTLKKVGFFSKETKSTDYKAQAERVCHFFGYESVYELTGLLFFKASFQMLTGPNRFYIQWL